MLIQRIYFFIIYTLHYLFSIYSVLFFLCYLLFFLSLEKCYDGFDICATKTSWIFVKLFEASLSYIGIAFLLEGIIIKIISKYHLLHLIFAYILFYNYSHGLDYDDHGYYNFIGFISIVSLILLLFVPFYILIKIYKKNKKQYIFIYLGFLFIIINYCFAFSKYYLNCNDWGKGLNQTYIDNNIEKHGCFIKLPEICYYKIGKYIFDFTKLKKVECSNNKEDTKKVLQKFSESKYVNESTKRYGFPLVNKFHYLNNKIDYNFNISQYVKENIIDMDNINLVKQVFNDNIPEIIVDFTSNNYGEIVINLTYNDTLSKERKLKEKNSESYSNNIILLYIDSISRAYSIRQLKKTLSFFEQFMTYKGKSHKNFPSENFHSFQFFKYHSFEGYTHSNYPIIFFGNKAGENITRIIKYFRDNGFVTSYSNDMCLRDMTDTNHRISYDEIGDHEFIICDPNKKHCNSHIKRCLYNKLSTAHLYEYGKQFWEKYSSNRKLLIIASNDGHEGTLEILKYIDSTLFNFLNDLYNKNLFKDSTIFLLSDHGTAMPSPYYLSLFFQKERYLPMLFILSNDRKNISYSEQYKYIHENQQILITAYDIYNTLGHLLFGKKYDLIPNKTKDKDTPKSKYGISLFNKIESKKRNPKNYQNMVKDICL